MLISSREKLQTLLHVVLLLFGRGPDAFSMEIAKAGSEASKEVKSSHGLNFEPGPKYKELCASWDTKIVEGAGGKRPFDFEESVTGQKIVRPYAEIWDDNANSILKDEESDSKKIEIKEAGEKLFAKYMEKIWEANEGGRYSLITNLEGPDLPSAVQYSDEVGKYPERVLVRPNDEKPKIDFEAAKKALVASGFPEPQRVASASDSDEHIEALGTFIGGKIKDGQTYHLVVYGDPKPIADLFNNQFLKENMEKIFITHVGSPYWYKAKDKIVWGSAWNAKTPGVEKKLSELGVQRICIASGAIQPEGFFNLVDQKLAVFHLKDYPKIKIDFSGGVKNMHSFYSGESGNGAAKLIGETMEAAARKIYEPRLLFLQNVQNARLTLENLSKDKNEREKAVTAEVLRLAMQYEKEAKSDEISPMKDTTEEVNPVDYWNAKNANTLDAVCEKLMDKKYDRRDLQKEEIPLHLQIYSQLVLDDMLANDKKETLRRLLLNAQLFKRGELKYSIHANEGLAMITALKYDENEPHAFGIPLVHTPGSEEFSLTPDVNGKAVYLTSVDLPKILSGWKQHFERKTPKA